MRNINFCLIVGLILGTGIVLVVDGLGPESVTLLIYLDFSMALNITNLVTI